MMNETNKNMFLILGGVNRLVAMIGAKNATYSNNTNTIQFQHMRCKKTNRFSMHYNEATDLFDLKFFSIRKHNVINETSIEDVYIDMVREIFEQETGLYLSL